MKSFHIFSENMKLKRENYPKIHAKTQVQLHHDVLLKNPSYVDLRIVKNRLEMHLR